MSTEATEARLVGMEGAAAVAAVEPEDTPSETFLELKRKIREKQARVGVIGLGYVGLPLALAFENTGFSVTGIDIDSRKVDGLRSGRSTTTDIPDGELAAALGRGRFTPSSELDVLAALDTISICVP